MADHTEVLARIRAQARRALSGADAEPEGLRGRARRGRDEVGVFGAASRGVLAARTSTARSPNRSSASGRSPRQRKKHGMKVRGYVSCVLGCPYEGEVAPAARRGGRRARCYDMGCYEVSLGDTIGVGTPGEDARRCSKPAPSACRSRSSPATSTTPTARRSPTSTPRSSSASRTFDASVAGLGGCPYAAGRDGQRRDRGRGLHAARPGHRTGIDLDKLVDIGRWICGVLGTRAVFQGRQGIQQEAVKSPCIKVCQMDPQRGLCLGCARTLDEIARWGIDERRRARAASWPSFAPETA